MCVQDERGRLMRRNIVRYAVLAYVITLKHVSVRVKKRFPTLQHIVDAGISKQFFKPLFYIIKLVNYSNYKFCFITT